MMGQNRSEAVGGMTMGLEVQRKEAEFVGVSLTHSYTHTHTLVCHIESRYGLKLTSSCFYLLSTEIASKCSTESFLLFLFLFFSAENEALEGNTKCDVIMGTSHWP